MPWFLLLFRTEAVYILFTLKALEISVGLSMRQHQRGARFLLKKKVPPPTVDHLVSKTPISHHPQTSSSPYHGRALNRMRRWMYSK